ncbi:apolipoprotein L6-like [Hoplias malabaricus]|uniref:apolipoprotein L6-like n=1 Tax=Hoplias malabaricus TaxID=27720 RepID=UPI003461AFF4
MMRDIKSRSEKFSAIFNKQALKRELEMVLKKILKGLGVLQHFLDAVEELAVTSLFVFMEEGILMQKVDTVEVKTFILTAKTMSPLLILFKRDAGHFFSPSMANVDVHAFYLEKYISITQLLCERISKNMLDVIGIQSLPPSRLSFRHRHITASIEQLSKIRMDKGFRLMFLFNGRPQDFIKTYRRCHSKMFQFLSDLEEPAVELDKMKKGSRISTVAGSSVGIAGGVLSIVGIALAPVTAGVSLALTLTGVGLGVTSGVNSLVTGITEIAVNRHHRNKAKNIFQNFMEHVQNVQDCLEQGSNQYLELSVNYSNIFPEAGKVISGARTVGKGIDTIVDGAAALKALQSEEVDMAAVKRHLQEAKAARSFPSLASDLPDIRKLARGTPLALSKSARAGFITLNALFIGLDVLLICKESVSLAKGEKSKKSQAIRSRSAQR